MVHAIREKLKRYNPKTISCTRSVMAGVIIPFFEKDGRAFILLTKRTHTVKAHKGEVSFPGGMYEEADGNTMETALRECQEEIGVEKRDVEIIGRLDDMHTLTGFVMSPYVGVIPYPYPFKTNGNEVAHLIFLPFDFLVSVEPAIEMAEYEGRPLPVPSFHFDGNRVWGATCRILLNLRDLVKNEGV